MRRLIRSEDVKNALIFCNRKRDVDILFKSLRRHGFDAAALHGDMPQPKRTETLERFKNDEIRLLVASDVAARGLDIKGMSHVFCFDVPIHAEDYVHRIGRTGRAGLSGRSLMLAAPEDGKAVAAIVKLIGKEIPPIVVDGIAPPQLEFEERRRGRGALRGQSARASRTENPHSRRRRGASHRQRRPPAPRPGTGRASAAPDRSQQAPRPPTTRAKRQWHNVTLFPRPRSPTAGRARQSANQGRRSPGRRLWRRSPGLPRPAAADCCPPLSRLRQARARPR